jgi:hypothetical protein
MIVFIFSKYFEFYKFVAFLYKCDHVFLMNVNKLSDYEVSFIFYYKNKNEIIQLNCLIINDSDINFYSIISKLLNEKNKKYILIGSCGSYHYNELKKLCFIEKSFKIDRGILIKNNVFKIREDKITTREPKLDFLTKNYYEMLNTKNIIKLKNSTSSNYIVDNLIDNKYINYVADMETYDFYDVCLKNNISQYYCVRFITDIYRQEEQSKLNYLDNLKMCLNEKDFRFLYLDLQNFELEDIKKLIRLSITIDFEKILEFDFTDNYFLSPQQNSYNITYNENKLNDYYQLFKNQYMKCYDKIKTSDQQKTTRHYYKSQEIIIKEKIQEKYKLYMGFMPLTHKRKFEEFMLR